MTEMFNPPHPGKILREYLEEMDVTTAAKRLHVSRATLSRILNGAASISADMSLRLSDALGTHAGFWYDLQTGYDLWRAAHKKRPKIERFDVAA
jgi:addiction module HigA family antidote